MARTAVQLFHQTGDQTWLLTAVTEEALSTELNPLDGRSPYRLGTLYGLLAGQKVSPEQRKLLLDRAVAAFEQAIRTDPFSPLNYWELGKIRLGEGQLVEARHWFNLAKTYEPNFLPARVLLAELAFQNGEVELAEAEYAAVVAVKRKYERWNLNETERQFLEVDLYPLGRALALRSKT